MPKVEIEISRTVTITRDESVVVELNVPKRVLDDEEVLNWLDEVMDRGDGGGTLTANDKAVYEAVNEAEWEAAEDEGVEYTDAYAVD